MWRPATEPGDREVSAGLSTWWATPARPDQYFSQDELAASDRYHRPLRRAAAATVIGRVALLLVAALLLTGPLANLGSGPVGDIRSESWLSRAGLLEIMISRSVLLGAAGVALALRIPSIAVDAWFEYRFRQQNGSSADPADDELPAVPVRQFIVTVVALTCLVWVVVIVAASVGYRLMAATRWWPWLLAVVALFCVVLAAIVEERVRRLTPGHGEVEDAGPRFDHLAERFGLTGLRFQIGAPGPALSPAARHPNANTVGVGPSRRIVVNQSLLAEPRSLQEFVVAHELSHVKRQHVLAQSALGLVLVIVAMQLIAAVIESDAARPVFDAGLNDPMLLPAVALGVFAVAGVIGPALSWFARFHERVADADAIETVGPLPADLDRRLHGTTAVDLDPPWWIRIFDQHPTPTERLEFSARHRRAI